MKIYEIMNDPKNAVWVSFLVMFIFGFFMIVPRNLSIALLNVIELDFLVELTISFIIQFLFAGFACLILIPLLLGVPARIKPYRTYIESIQLTQYKPIGKLLFIGITATVFILFFSLFLTSITGDLNIHPQNVFGSPVLNPSDPEMSVLGWFGFIMFLTPGIWEEVYARGIILTILLRKYPEEKGEYHKAILISGIIFGLTHILDIPGLIRDPIFILIQVVWSSIIGIAFGYLRVATKSLLPSILTHWLIDSFNAYISPGGNPILFLILFMIAITIASGLIILLVYQTTNIGKLEKKKTHEIKDLT